VRSRPAVTSARQQAVERDLGEDARDRLGAQLTGRVEPRVAPVGHRQQRAPLHETFAPAYTLPNRTSAALTEAKEIVTTLSLSFQERHVEEALFARQL